MNTYRNFIAGKWVESTSTRKAENVNPANTDDILGTMRLATRDEARQAVEAAAEAFRAWRSTPAPTRGRIVGKAARLMEEHKEELSQILTREEGKTIAESRGELQRSINVAEFCAGESRRMTGETIPSELPLNFAYTIKQPLGHGPGVRRHGRGGHERQLRRAPCHRPAGPAAGRSCSPAGPHP